MDELRLQRRVVAIAGVFLPWLIACAADTPQSDGADIDAGGSTDRALPHDQRDAQTVERCVVAFREAYRRRWNVHTRPYDGISELLDELSRDRWRLAVLSNKPDEFTQGCVHHYLSAWKFEVVFGQREGVPRKPDPTAAHEIASLLGVPSSR